MTQNVSGAATEESATQPAIFSGAGLSGAPPACLPLGYALRNAVLDVMFEQAHAYASAFVTIAQRDELRAPARKLEQVLGRLWGVVGDDALMCLTCLHPLEPNRAHVLAALHLARGGTHVTLNFDRGIEVAYARLGGVPPLRVVVIRDEFDRWVADRRPPALLKLHGGVAPNGEGLLDVVVEDTEQLGGLYPSRLAAVQALAEAPELIITGYGGLDPDVYGPLLEAAARTRSTWTTVWLADDSPIRADCERCGIEVIAGDPEGLATTVLATLVGEADGFNDVADDVPVSTSADWRDRFDAWAQSLSECHDAAGFALGWAWLLGDAGDRDSAAALLRHVLRRDASDGARLRLADVLYDRARGNDRVEALRLYAGMAARRELAWPTRAHCILRIGGVARGRGHVLLALAAPAVVLARRGGDQESNAAAHAVVGQTVLRACERAALIWPLATRPILVRALRWAAARCATGARQTLNGNRRALAMSHRLLALALAAYLAGDDPNPRWDDQLRALAETYRNAGDPAGAGNCAAARAVFAATRGDRQAARQLLVEAREFYAEGRPRGELVPSGAALLRRIRRLIDEPLGD